jgi:hypothetical protein
MKPHSREGGRNAWIVLIGIGLALVGVWGAWVPHRAAALVLSSWDLAEFAKFVPNVTAIRELFFLPVWSAGLVIGLLANRWPEQRGGRLFSPGRVGLGLLALVLMMAILPPYPSLFSGYRTAEFRWQFVLGVSGVLLVGISWLSPAWSLRLLGGMWVLLAFVGAIPALWQFLQLREAIAAVYGAALGWGWGLVPFVTGWTLIAVTGAWLLWHRAENQASYAPG